MKLLYSILLSFILPFVLQGKPNDSDGQTVRGKVSDKISLLPVEGVNIEILNLVPHVATTSDQEGRFRLENVPIGRYKLLLRKQGYKDLTIGVEVTAAKESMSMLNLKMEEQVQDVDPINPNPTTDPNDPKPTKIQSVPVETGKDRPNNAMSIGATRFFSLEEVNRFAGDRQDASRLVSNYAGVNVMDDYHNHLMIRGNSPALMEWRLEGMPIYNPNHIGTFGNTGGRYNILNPNIMDNSDLSIGAMAPEYGNAIAGVFDVRLRDGDDERFHISTQYSSASGAQLLLEGPMAKNNKASFIVGYRYGLFNYLGYALDLGIRAAGANQTITLPETAPTFHDFNLKINISAGKAGTFTLFGIGGLSQQKLNGFNAALAEKDQFVHIEERSNYNSSSFVVGLKHEAFLGKKGLVYWRNTIGLPFVLVKNQTDVRINGHNVNTTEYLRGFDASITYSTLVNRKFSKKFSMGGGGIARVIFNSIDAFRIDEDGDTDRDSLDFFGNLIQGFVQAQYNPTNNLRIAGGVYSQVFLFNNSYSIEPRLSLRWYFLPRHSLYVSGGMHSQTLPIEVYAHKDDEDEEELNLDFMRSVHALLGYQFVVSEAWRIKVDAYYQHHYKIPISPDQGNFSLLQYGSLFPFAHVDSFLSIGTGRNYGVELSIEKLFDKGYYILFNAAYNKATTRGFDGVHRPSPFAPLYVLRLAAGKEFKIGKNKVNRFSIDLKANHYNFRNTLSVNEQASAQYSTTIYHTDNGYIEKLPPYFRLDLRLAFIFNSQKANITHRLAFDFLNVTNQKNVLGYYYNTVNQATTPYYNFPVYLDILYQFRF